MRSYVCKAKWACLGETRAPGRRSRKPNIDTFTAPTTLNVVVLRVGDAWLVGVGKRAPYGFQCVCWSLLMSRWMDSTAHKIFLYIEL